MSTSDITTTPRRNIIALVVGGGENVWKEFRAAQELMRVSGTPHVIYAINDMIPDMPETMTACTLHPAKLPIWLRARHTKKHPPPLAIWSHRWGKHVTNKLEGEEWKGSSGLMASRVALIHGFRVILCGVPMQAEANHFKRHSRWHAVSAFRGGWLRNIEALEGRVKSISGWTKEILGAPTMEWIQQCQK